MPSSHRNEPALERALEIASGLKPGSWESVEALALLAVETAGTPKAMVLLEAATKAAANLKSGTWESAHALAWLARAEREVNPS